MKYRYVFMAAAIMFAAAALPYQAATPVAAGGPDMSAVRSATSRFHRLDVATGEGYEAFVGDLQSVLDGNLDELIGALTTYYTAEKLREVTETQ